MEKPDEKIIDDLRAAHPDREVVPLKVKVKGSSDEEFYYFVVALPERPAWNRFKEAALDEERRASATEDMVKSSILYPPMAEFMKTLKKRPGLVQTLGNQLSRLVGMSSEVEVGNW